MGPRAEPRLVASPRPRLPERYEPLRPIASGGSAVVWCAEDHLLGRRVAIKLLAEPYASDLSAVRRFKREARAAARLSGHPHVVTIFDVGEGIGDGVSHGQPFIVMEYLAGGTVADALRVGAVTLDEGVRWLHEAAEAIDYAHAKGILHRDIKPANLLLDPHRVLYVADFGIAQIGHEDTLTLSGQVLGTASYLAPERALGRPATKASDLYSLAVAGFELLTGERPFSATAYVAQARAHLELEPPAASERNSRLPRALDSVLARGMAKRPEDRWPSAEAFAAAVERALAPAADPAARRAAAVVRGRRVAAARATGHRRPRPAPAPAEHPRSPRSRRSVPLGLLAGAVASLAIMAGGIAWALSGSAKPRPRLSAARTTPAVHHATAAVHKLAPAHHAAPAPKTTPTVTVQRAANTTPTPPTADTLAAQGHSLIDSGQYSAAIALLQRAVDAASPGSLTYAYALYDLGHAYLLAGNPRAAVPILAQRLKIDNQRPVVLSTLRQALLELGAAANQSGGVAPTGPATSKPPKPSKDHGRGHDHGPAAATSRD
jgi:eukaryotic-like serine/threonine-protein kinase